jgi:hypothetical protein
MLIERPTPPTVGRPNLAVPKDAARSCACQDPDLVRLLDLIAAGWSQHDASLLLWAPDRLSVAARVAGGEHRPWVTSFVRLSFQRAFPWLRLPPIEVSPSD